MPRKSKDMYYPHTLIEPERIEKKCRWCGGEENLKQDPRSKDWWHPKCHKKIHRITRKEVESHVNKRMWGRNYKNKA
jgi:hypothetical protein